jgi:hypothetical protein
MVEFDKLTVGAHTGITGFSGSTTHILKVKVEGNAYVLVRGKGVYGGNLKTTGLEVENHLRQLINEGVDSMIGNEKIFRDMEKRYAKNQQKKESQGGKNGKGQNKQQ